jgi:hypothetical protein
MAGQDRERLDPDERRELIAWPARIPLLERGTEPAAQRLKELVFNVRVDDGNRMKSSFEF